MKNNNHSSSSRRRTPWDSRPFLTPVQNFLKEGYLSRYDYRHPSLNSLDEKKLVNSYVPDSCPKCGSICFAKDGKDSYGIRRYRCKDCSKRFTVLTCTIFDSHKIGIKEWIDYLLELFGYVSFSAISKSERIADSTTKYWLKKLFVLLEDYQDDTVLSGRVYLDETYYHEIKRKLEKPLAGRNNIYCIGVAVDDFRTVAILEGKGKGTTREKTLDSFRNHIAEYSTLVHDKTSVHSYLIDCLHLESEQHHSKEEGNPLKKINDTHALLKQFLNSHRGFRREDLQNYLNLFCFMSNPPYDRLEKIEILLNMAFSRKICLRYRKTMSRKVDKI